MRRQVARIAGALVLSGCVSESSGPPRTETRASATDGASIVIDSTLPVSATPPSISVDTLATGLEVPWGIAFAPDGRIFVTERPGRIRVLASAGLETAPWATVEVHEKFGSWGPESGLLGIAIAPDFATSGHLFVLATVWRSDGDRTGAQPTRLWRRIGGAVSPGAGFVVENRVIRFTERGGRGTEPTVIVRGLPAHHYHAGGGLAFGPDGKLYVSIGDATRPELAAGTELLAGKILRFERDGSIPDDNPLAGSPVWARGLRNTQSFVWLADGTMIGAEHGPTGMPQEEGRAGQDELNVLRAGADYGWPRATGWAVADGSRAPLWVWREGIAPAGLAVSGIGSDGSTASLVVGGLRRRLERLTLARSPDGAWRAVTLDTLLGAGWGRLRTVVAAPDGSLLVTTSNRDARGQSGPADDLLLRVRITP